MKYKNFMWRKNQEYKKKKVKSIPTYIFKNLKIIQEERLKEKILL